MNGQTESYPSNQDREAGRGAGRPERERRRVVGVRDVWRAATRLRGWHEQDESRRGKYRQAEGLRRCGQKDLRRHRAAGFLLMIDNRTRAQRDDGLMPREMCVQGLAVMMPGIRLVEVHVHQRRGNRA